MTSPNLENLARAGELQAEPPAKLEFDGLVASALSFLGDARKPSLATVSRFNLAYEAAHALSLAALRWLIEITGRLLDAVEKLGPVAGANSP